MPSEGRKFSPQFYVMNSEQKQVGLFIFVIFPELIIFQVQWEKIFISK
jgi:hypothetical protein